MDKRLNMPNHVVQLNMKVQLANTDIAQNTIYMHHVQEEAGVTTDATFSDVEAADQAHKAATAWGTQVAPLCASDCFLFAVDWVWNTNVTTGPLKEGTYTLPATIGGEGTGESLPAGVSKALEFKTGFGGRDGHGRIFIPAIPKGYLDATHGDELSAGAQTTYAAAAAGWLAAFNNNDFIAGVGDGYSQCVVSFVKNGANRVPATLHDVTQVLFREYFLDYQRRRAPFHARHH